MDRFFAAFGESKTGPLPALREPIVCVALDA
jgi:hypothetical protein